MTWKKTIALFGITPEIRERVEEADPHAAFIANNISRQVELQIAVNRHRNAWDKWVKVKALVKSTRDAWEEAFDAYRLDGGGGPSVAEQLNELHQREATLTREQQEAFTAGNLEAAKTAFEALQDIVAKVRQLEETAINKQVGPAEAAKQTAQKEWRRAQVTEAEARDEHLIALALLLTLADSLDEKGLKEFGRLLKNPPDFGAYRIPVFSETDAVVPTDRFSLAETGDDNNASGPDTEEETTTPNGSEQ